MNETDHFDLTARSVFDNSDLNLIPMSSRSKHGFFRFDQERYFLFNRFRSLRRKANRGGDRNNRDKAGW